MESSFKFTLVIACDGSGPGHKLVIVLPHLRTGTPGVGWSCNANTPARDVSESQLGEQRFYLSNSDTRARGSGRDGSPVTTGVGLLQDVEMKE